MYFKMLQFSRGLDILDVDSTLYIIDNYMVLHIYFNANVLQQYW